MSKFEQLLIGPFQQILPMTNLPEKGSIEDEELVIIENGGVLIEDGKIIKVDSFDLMVEYAMHHEIEIQVIREPMVLLPGFIDSHTHICHGGSREKDYAMRISGKSYLEIAANGGGIIDSVKQTRAAKKEDLIRSITNKAILHFNEGVTTCEVKSGYGLSLQEELKMLEAIQDADQSLQIDLVPTCLAAHTKPPEFKDASSYVDYCVQEILPEVKNKNLANRADIFIEQGAFGESESRTYLNAAKNLGFEITVHADQFSSLGSRLAVEFNALSADHLESSTSEDVKLLAQSNTIATVLPGASLGLGMQYSPARNLLDAGACVSIASDWNPGSAPMGDLLTNAALISAQQKLSNAETLAGITTRAAKALALSDRGTVEVGMLADLIAFQCEDYRSILYYQGKLKPKFVWKKGVKSKDVSRDK